MTSAWFTLVALGFVCWVVTLVLVESVLFEPWRNFTARIHAKLHYLSGCQLCTGTWVGLGLGFLHPIPGFGPLISGLAYKGIAHFILVVRNLLDALHHV